MLSSSKPLTRSVAPSIGLPHGRSNGRRQRAPDACLLEPTVSMAIAIAAAVPEIFVTVLKVKVSMQ
jgi:hypothetical protein